ncbi:MAG TPA: glycosyltransferase family 4 protein [Thermoleophilaceae bacterium]
MEPLSFCMVTTFYPPYHFGGDGTFIHRLSNALAQRGHRVTVVHCLDAHATLKGVPSEATFENHPNVTVHRLHSRAGAVSPLVTYLSGKPGLKRGALESIFENEHFDVVHFHNISLIGGPGVLSYGDGLKLYTMHEHWLVCPMHVLWKMDREPCVEPQCLRCSLAFHRPPQLWRYTGLLERQLQNVDMFLAPSRFAIQAHHERGFQHPIRQLPLFVPKSAAEPGRADSPSERPYFLFVGRLERLKGLQTLIELFREYDAADLVVAGEGKYGDALRRQAAGLEHVHFLGSVGGDRLRGLYADAIALLVPSVGFEVAPFVCLEAFAQGTPVIARELGGAHETVTDSGAGYSYRTDEELLASMESLHTDPALRQSLGERAHSAYLERWSEDAHMSAYLALIEEARAAEARNAAAEAPA